MNRIIPFANSGIPVRLPHIVQNGDFFGLETGERWTMIEASDFNLLGRFIVEGPEAIKPVIAQRAEIGFNTLRVWTLYDLVAANIGRLLYTEHPELYDRIPSFCELVAQYGSMYIEFTAYTGVNDLNHWQRLGDTAQGQSNIMGLELVNEYPANPIDFTLFHPIPGILCSHGSNYSEQIPPRPAWGYEVLHLNDAPEWYRKPHNAMEDLANVSHVPAIVNESTRCPDHCNLIYHYYDHAACGALLCAGTCFHSVNGKRSWPFEGIELNCAIAHVAGARYVPVKYQVGRYDHLTNLEGPNDLRAYARTLPDGDRWVVIVRK